MLARCARGVACRTATRGFSTAKNSGWNRPLREQDPELYQLVRREQDRQLRGLEMIASENFTSRAVMECLGSCLTNKYAEGEVGARYYGGNEVIDLVEQLAKDRALAAFGLDAKEWGCNVQPYSGSPANLAVYTGLLNPHDRLMGMALPSGGHLTHGHYTPAKKISAVSIFFESLPYKVRDDGWIDYDELRSKALEYRPKLIICGGSAYPRVLDFPKFAAIADEVGAYLMADIAHISGLVAAGEHPSPFPYCDVVTTTTHKSLRGPRSGIVFARRRPRKEGGEPNLIDKINFACFPGLQGGPHEHQIAGVAAQLKEVATQEFRDYARQVIANSRALAEALTQKGHKLATGGTDNHLMLWDVRPFDLTGSKLEKLLDQASITVNKNSIAGDKSAAAPGAVRLGTCALTTRGMREDEFRFIAGLLDRSLRVAVEIQAKVGKKLKDFEVATQNHAELQAIRKEVEEFAVKFPMPGREI